MCLEPYPPPTSTSRGSPLPFPEGCSSAGSAPTAGAARQVPRLGEACGGRGCVVIDRGACCEPGTQRVGLCRDATLGGSAFPHKPTQNNHQAQTSAMRSIQSPPAQLSVSRSESPFPPETLGVVCHCWSQQPHYPVGFGNLMVSSFSKILLNMFF